ncbi:hypothetical protein AB4306_18410 [Vibrio splendidus]
MMKVKKKCCGKCLFGSNKIVSDSRKKSILSDCAKNDSHFVCHEGTMKNEDIVCRAFFEQRSSNMIRIAQRLNMITYVD